LEPNSAFYNMPHALRLTGTLDVAALEESLNEVVRRHETLRTTFPAVEGRPRQEIAPALRLPLPVIDLGHLPQPEREAAALRLVEEEAQRPFDLARGPLVRASLLRLEESEQIVLVTLHHILGDEWSTNVLVEEITALYEGMVRGERPALRELGIQYADYAAWQREWLQGELLERELAYWKERLWGSPPLLELPTDRPRPAVQTYGGAGQAFTLPPDLAHALRSLGQQEGATLFMTALAAFQVLLHRYTGQEDLCVGTPTANRNRAEIEGLIGFFVNTLVLR